jgi:hypothetical protein
VSDIDERMADLKRRFREMVASRPDPRNRPEPLYPLPRYDACYYEAMQRCDEEDGIVEPSGMYARCDCGVTYDADRNSRCPACGEPAEPLVAGRR